MGILDAPAQNPQDRRRQFSYLRGLQPITTRLLSSHSADFSAIWSDGVATSKFHRLKVTVTADATDLRLVFPNYSYGTAGLSTIYITAAVETVDTASPVSHQVYFNGTAEGTVSPDGVLISDPVPISVKKGATLWLRTFVRVATAGDKWPASGAYYWQAGDAVTADTVAAVTTTSTTGLTGPLLGAQYVEGYAPAAVLGTVKTGTPTFALWGDSITVGMNDQQNDLYRGWAERALAGNYPYVNVSRHNERASQVVPSPAVGTTSGYTPVAYRHKRRFADGCTHVVSGYGVNDVGSDSLAVMQANLISHWVEMSGRGLKVWQYTLPPHTSSTDKWATLANQTATGIESNRTAANDWIRDGAPILANGNAAATGSAAAGTVRAGTSSHPLRGYLETADQVESSRNSGKWKAANRSVGDAVMTSGSSTLTSATANFSAADVGSYVAVVGAGASAATLVTTITVYTNSTTVTLNNTAGTAVSGASLAVGLWTTDGLHPSKQGHVAMAAALNPAAIAAS